MSLSSELEVTLLAGPNNDLVNSNQCVSNHSESPRNPAGPSQKLITDYCFTDY